MREQRRFHSATWRNAVEVEIGVQLAIQPRQDVLVELGGHALRIVVGRHQNLRALGQVRAQQQRVARAQERRMRRRMRIASCGSKLPMLEPMYSTSLRPLMRFSACDASGVVGHNGIHAQLRKLARPAASPLPSAPLGETSMG